MNLNHDGVEIPTQHRNIIEIFLENIVKLPKYFKILLKYCKKLTMSTQNMTYAIFSKYYQN